ncbi:hypothetical protein Tco_0435170 [Tanacetum coccineum]
MSLWKSDPEPARRRPSSIAFRDTSSMSKKISPNSSQKLKGIQILTIEEQLAADTMQALKASRKSSRSQRHAGGSSKGTGTKPEVPDESTVILTTSHKRTGTKPRVPDEKDDDDDDRSIDIEKTDDEEESDNEFVQGDKYVQDDVDEEMKDAEVAETRKSDEEITDMEKADAEKKEEVKDDNKLAELPPSSSSLSVSSGFGNQFLNHSSDKSTVGKLKDTSPSILTIYVSVIPKPTVLSPIPKIPTETHATTILPSLSVTTIIPVLQKQSTPIPTPPITTVAPTVTTIPDPLPAVIQIVSVLEKDVQELKEVDHTTTLLALLRSEIPSAVNAYLDPLWEMHFKRCFRNILKNLNINILSKLITRMSLKISYLTHDKHQALFDALFNSLCLDDEVARGQANLEKIFRKRDHDGDDKDEDPSAGPNQGSKPDKSVHAEESVAKPMKEVIMDTSNDDVANDADQPQNDPAPKHN